MLRQTPRNARKTPHLHRDRLGTFYFRITAGGRTIKRSLRTKDPDLATMLASNLNWEGTMKKRASEPTAAEVIKAVKSGETRQFDVVLPNGMQINNINSDEDADRAKRFIAGLDVDNIGVIEPHLRPLRPEYAHLAAKPSPARPFLKATKHYLREKGKGNQNSEKTL